MTEKICERYNGFETWDPIEALNAMYEGQLSAVSAIRSEIPSIAIAGVTAAQRLEDTGRLVYVGAGTSGRIAVQDGAELGPTFGWPKARTKFCVAGGLGALTSSLEGAEDDFDKGSAEVADLCLTSNDVAICVAASGETPYTVGALEQAKKAGAWVIGIANNPNVEILSNSHAPILLDTGSEAIAGSTRMKAGTSQKVVLNMLSTLIMLRLGRVYKGMMVDMDVSNDKLKRRAIGIVSEISGCEVSVAEGALSLANNDIKQAVLISLGQTPESSIQVLKSAQGNLLNALTAIDAIGKAQ